MPTTIVSAGLDSNDLVMSYAREATWGTKPTVPFQQIRLDGEGFSSSKSRTRPSEINPAGQASSAITTKVESTGSLNFSLSAGTFNDFLAASLGGTWTHPAYIPASNTVALTATTITDSASGFLTGLGLVAASAGFVVKLTCTGTASAALSGSTYYVTACAAGVLTCTLLSGPAMAVRTVAEVGTCKLEVISMSQTSTATIAVTATGFTDSGNHFIDNGYVVGQMIKVYCQTSTIAGIYRIKTLAAGTMDTVPAPPSTAVAAITTYIKGNMVRNGLVFDSFFVQKYLAAGKFLTYPGAFVTGGSLDVGVGDYLKGTFSFINKSETKAIAEGSTGTAIPAPSGVVIDSIAGIGTPMRGNSTGTTFAEIAAKVQKVGIKWNKEGAANQYAIGSSASVGMRKGSMTVTGSLSTYFADFTLYDEFVNDTQGSFGFEAKDNVGDGYFITLCSATIQNPKIVAGGPGQDVMAEFELEGNPDTLNLYGGKTIQIDYFDAA